MPFPDIMRADKMLAQFPGWTEPEVETGYCWFNAPLSIGGVVQQGLVLHGGCLKNVPDAHVTFVIQATKPGTRRIIPLARIDWRSVTGGHSNPRRSGSPVSGKRCTNSHHHAFDLNWLEADGRMRGGNDLPMADDFPQEIQSFEGLLDMVGNLFRINNIEVVSPPKWEYELFRNG
jgi:hypothetical protein